MGLQFSGPGRRTRPVARGGSRVVHFASIYATCPVPRAERVAMPRNASRPAVLACIAGRLGRSAGPVVACLTDRLGQWEERSTWFIEGRFMTLKELGCH